MVRGKRQPLSRVLMIVAAVVLVLVSCLTAVANGHTYKDPKQRLGARIRDLMKRMTLEEKIGQMVQIERKVATPDVMKNYFIGKQNSCILEYHKSLLV